MYLELIRTHEASDCVLGNLKINTEFFCKTLELPIGNGGHDCAIPTGIYRIIINMSPKFGHPMMRIVDVPGRSGILIHKGNKPEDTEGCILVGKELVENRIKAGTSTPAYNELYYLVAEALIKEENVIITVRNELTDG